MCFSVSICIVYDINVGTVHLASMCWVLLVKIAFYIKSLATWTMNTITHCIRIYPIIEHTHIAPPHIYVPMTKFRIKSKFKFTFCLDVISVFGPTHFKSFFLLGTIWYVVYILYMNHSINKYKLQSSIYVCACAIKCNTPINKIQNI